jgi:glycine oxidase
LNLIRVMPAKGAGAEVAHSADTVVDAVVVGGGLIGLACAWRLAQRDLSVAVVDPAPGSAASRAAAGMLAPVSEVRYGEEPLLALGLESLRRYPAFVRELEQVTGQLVGLRQEGTLIAATDSGDRALLVELHAFQISLGLDARLLTSGECREVEPALSPDVRCGLLAASDHSVDNRRLSAALLSAAASAGATVVRDRISSVEVDGRTVDGVTLDSGGRIHATSIVLAAGPWSGTIPGVPDIACPPVRPVKGEIIRLRARAGSALPGHSVRGLVNGHEIYLVPRTDGELVVGATVEEAGFDTTVRAGAVRELLRDARAVVPGVDELELVETTAALRPGSPDNRPIIGPTVVDGLHAACGHHRNGVLLTPITADLITSLVCGDDADAQLLELVAPNRFASALA